VTGVQLDVQLPCNYRATRGRATPLIPPSRLARLHACALGRFGGRLPARGEIMVEDFFKAHQHTIAAIAAVGTLAAVITSLVLAYVARRADRTRLRARATLVTLLHDTIDPRSAPKFLRVDITNHGRWSVRIPVPFFYWKVPFKRGVMVARPLDHTNSHWIGKKDYPTDVGPRTSESFFISDLATFRQEVKRIRGADTFVNRLRFRFIRAFVQMDDDETFRVKLSSHVREVWLAKA
jgi:hypothetical protein